jgi:hypothetical protein
MSVIGGSRFYVVLKNKDQAFYDPITKFARETSLLIMYEVHTS